MKHGPEIGFVICIKMWSFGDRWSERRSFRRNCAVDWKFNLQSNHSGLLDAKIVSKLGERDGQNQIASFLASILASKHGSSVTFYEVL